MLDCPSPIRRQAIGPEPRPQESRNAWTASSTRSGARSSPSASALEETTSTPSASTSRSAVISGRFMGAHERLATKRLSALYSLPAPAAGPSRDGPLVSLVRAVVDPEGAYFVEVLRERKPVR